MVKGRKRRRTPRTTLTCTTDDTDVDGVADGCRTGADPAEAASSALEPAYGDEAFTIFICDSGKDFLYVFTKNPENQLKSSPRASKSQ